MTGLDTESDNADETAWAAVAIFVKTARLSPVKTRLAAGIGAAAAGEFYELACDAVASVVHEAERRSAGAVRGYWAVADAGTTVDWPGFALAGQGDGGLGSRLWRVYADLRRRHEVVCLIGADAPQLTAAALSAAAEKARASRGFCVGPARDGGFYLLAGAAAVERPLWESVTYSSDSTLAELRQALLDVAPIETLRGLTDVDTEGDLEVVRKELHALAADKATTAAQGRLLEWLDRRVGRR